MSVHTITDLFSEQSLRNPQGIALEFNSLSLTYQDVEQQSNQLAHYLIKKGIQKNTCIPILIDRSFEMIIGILGILKTGAAYVPIDPAYPFERKEYILNDLNAAFIITTTRNQISCKCTEVLLDQDWDSITSESTIKPVIEQDGEDLSYIIYTSGSTGKPKGVMIQHQSLANFIVNQGAYYGVKADDKLLMFSSYAFDASVEQLFLALTTGATLVLLADELLLDIEGFTQYIVNKKVSHLDVTPGFLENLDPKRFTALKRIISGGDVCRKSLFLRWADQVDFYNVYGPTEATVTTTAYKCDQKYLTKYRVLPIGKPLKGTTIHILNALQQPVQEGETGEIYISGQQLAKGYYNNEALTAQNFVTIPEFGERLYRTGDKGRYLAENNIEFIGRVDEQVKVRGYRIELGEIENSLQEAPFVKECVILAKDGVDDEKQLVGFVVLNTTFSKVQIENYLAAKLPEFMIPRLWVALDKLPLTVNGKIDKNSLLIPDHADLISTPYVAPKTALEKHLAQIWKEVLGVKRVGTADNFFDLGGNSLLAQRLIVAMNAQKVNILITKLYQYPTIAGIVKHLNTTTKVNPSTSGTVAHQQGRDIAVIGMAGRFPGADTIDELWNLLTEGKETTSFFTDEELDVNIPASIRNDSLYIKARGIIHNATMFDPDFFGINKKLAELMDPQQRIFLEIAWEVLEKAGHLPSKVNYKTGVFAGCGPNFYYENNVLSHPDKIDRIGKLQVTTVNDKDYIASRTAYHLNLKGPAININSACSTSLLAILEAVNSLRSGQCELALAGGSSINPSIKSGHIYSEGSILSKDGHCLPFDDRATGTIFSDGTGAVLLKRLEDAERDGDTIFAVIKGVGVSNDGADKASFTAPSAEGQADAIISAIHDGNIEARDITYIETHGTGTPIGDPIEFEGLMKAFGLQNDKQYCAIGSIKSNFGHLTEAAGVASFIKTCLSLHHKKLVPSIGFEKPNRNIDFKNSPFFVNQKLSDWTKPNRLAGVSSFGVGGTNVHVILSAYENEIKPAAAKKPFALLSWSAKTAGSLSAYGQQLENYIAQHPEVAVEDLAYSLMKSRNEFSHRRFAIINTAEAILPQLAEQNNHSTTAKHITALPNDLVFTFPGQGAQFSGMGAELYAEEAVYKQAIDECNEILKEIISEEITSVIFSKDPLMAEKLNNTQYTQPALFATEYALAKLWLSKGYQPDLLCGHSVGEYVAAHLAGIFSLADALKLVALRGQMISKLPEGDMLSVRMGYTTLMSILPQGLAIAAINTGNLCVVAGPKNKIAQFEELLNQQQIAHKRLLTSHAFHSEMMEPIVPEFKRLLENIELSTPKIPLISTITGRLLTNSEALDLNYWANHLRNTVHYQGATEYILENYQPVFLEVGPGQGLTVMTNQILNSKGMNITASFSLNSKEDANKTLLNAMGNLWNAGISINWKAFYQDQQRKFIELPGYSFDRNKYWVEVETKPEITDKPIQLNPVTENKIDMRKHNLIQGVKNVLEASSGIEFENVDLNKNFIEIGLDSLLLTQIAASLKKEFNVPVTFRQLNDECSTIQLLVNYLDQALPPMPEPVQQQVIPVQQAVSVQQAPMISTEVNPTALTLLSAQLELIAKQIQLLSGNGSQVTMPSVAQTNNLIPAIPVVSASANETATSLSEEEKKEIAKPFGATPKIDKGKFDLADKQQAFLNDLVNRYNTKTEKSKAYTAESRPFMADPRVVNGFKPATKELVYPIVMNRSSGSKMWDIDGNEYIDALNGFGSNLLGYQPACIKEAIHDQVEKGFEVGPQHHLAADVSKLICEFTQFDRVGLCSTGSEAVLGCIRLARTVTGRSLIVAFTGSYHGIFDEVLVRGTKKMKSFPAAAGIMPEAVQNILVLDYGTDETMAIIKERANEIAGVLVEPVQSRRPDFVPLEFLKTLRSFTTQADIPLIFDEVITGFRMHPGGAQAIFGIQADLAAYGKVVGAGIPIGVIAGKKSLMDALDGGGWNYGDQSTPEVGITYFAGTFVRHPLALAAAKASLTYMKQRGKALQDSINKKGEYITDELNTHFESRNLPITVVNYGSLWKVKFEQEVPFSELLFVLLREKGIHILDGFPCFMTEATSYADIDCIINAFASSLDEMILAGFFPGAKPKTYRKNAVVIDNSNPPIPGARLGKDKYGNIAWFIEDPNDNKTFLQIDLN